MNTMNLAELKVELKNMGVIGTYKLTKSEAMFIYRRLEEADDDGVTSAYDFIDEFIDNAFVDDDSDVIYNNHRIGKRINQDGSLINLCINFPYFLKEYQEYCIENRKKINKNMRNLMMEHCKLYYESIDDINRLPYVDYFLFSSFAFKRSRAINMAACKQLINCMVNYHDDPLEGYIEGLTRSILHNFDYHHFINWNPKLFSIFSESYVDRWFRISEIMGDQSHYLVRRIYSFTD